MRRKAVAALMLAAVGGCTSFQGGSDLGGGAPWSKGNGPRAVPGVMGPYGENVAIVAPYDTAPPGNPLVARQMMNQSVPLSAVQMNGPAGLPGMPPMPPGMAMARGPMLTPPGVPMGPGGPAGPYGPALAQ